MKETPNIKFPDTPIKNILDAETQEYIDARFPRTNDDNLQEDLATKFVTDGDFNEKLHLHHELGEKLEKEMNNELWKRYEKLLELGSYFEIQKSLNVELSHLLDKLKFVELRAETKKKYKLEKSDITEVEVADFYKEQIDSIKNELNAVRSQKVDSKNVGDVFDQYTKAKDQYENLYDILVTADPALN